MKNPCFDTSSRTDCPRRHAGCAATCPEWAKYEKKRAEKRAADKLTFEGNNDYQAVRSVRAELYRKHRLRKPFRNTNG